jgi:uncharacterized protein (DUF1800 family)
MLTPLSPERWDFRTAAHLYNRAGFGGPPAEIEKLVSLGAPKAVSSFVDFETVLDETRKPEWAKPDPEREARQRAIRQSDKSAEEKRMLQQQLQRETQQQIQELRGWWLDRMAKGPRPFQEKMVLFWHGHFATSVQKVREPYFMWRQNELFRRLATGNWEEMLIFMAQDPAMLVWLDQAQSRREHPNENFARELMELFTLGEGHYTERDVTEAARALTGWSLDRPNMKFIERPFTHDTGQKTVLGKTGNLNGYDVVRQIVSQPQAARFLTAKLWNFFAGEMPSPDLNDALAAVFRKSGSQIKPLMRTIFLCEEFYSDHLIRNQVKSPVQWLVNGVRILERPLPPREVSIGLLRSLGQDLLAPPNVKGWDGGLAWITTNNLLARYNQAALLVAGDAGAMNQALGSLRRPNQPAAAAMQAERRARFLRPGAADISKLVTEQERANPESLLAALERRLLQGRLKEAQGISLLKYLESEATLDDAVIANAIRLVMATPEFQLT